MAVDFTIFSRIDYWTLAAVPIDLDREGHSLGHGTGFFYAFGEQTYLVTAWHVLSGRDFQKGQSISPTGAWPSHVTIWWNPDRQPGREKSPQRLPLWNEAGDPNWIELRNGYEWIDVAVLPVHVPPGAQAYEVNELHQGSVPRGMGNDVFILGFPLANQPLKLPIWKRGSLASEPHIPELIQPYWFVDTASRSGMSGAPVIRRSYEPELSSASFLNLLYNPGHQGLTTFEGVYSGRFKGQTPEDAQLGIVWPLYWMARLIQKHLGESAYNAALAGEQERGLRVLRAYKAAMESAGRAS